VELLSSPSGSDVLGDDGTLRPLFIAQLPKNSGAALRDRPAVSDADDLQGSQVIAVLQRLIDRARGRAY